MKQGKLFTIFVLLLLVLGMAILPTTAQDEEVEPGYGMPDGYDVVVGNSNGAVTFTMDTNTIILTTPTDYAAVISGQEFADDAAELAFFLDRIGYSSGTGAPAQLPDGALLGVGTSNGRRSQQGFGYLYDLGRERFAVLSLHTGRGQIGAPLEDVNTVVSEFEFLGTIVDIALGAAEGGDEDRAGLSLLVRAAQNADASVLETLGGEGNFTVFAPTNQAFINLFAFLQAEYGLSVTDVMADENQALLTNILLYHVVAGDNFAADLSGIESGAVVNTLLSDPQDGIVISFNDDGVPRLNGTVDIVTADILASNGVIHVIDDVLIPQCVIDTLDGVGSCGGGADDSEGDDSAEEASDS